MIDIWKFIYDRILVGDLPFPVKIDWKFRNELIEANDQSRDVARVNAERRGSGKWKKMEHT